jgi:hypothetical protein
MLFVLVASSDTEAGVVNVILLLLFFLFGCAVWILPERMIQQVMDRARIEGADTIVEDTCSHHSAEFSVLEYFVEVFSNRARSLAQLQNGDPLSLS